jgi:ComF family protein
LSWIEEQEGQRGLPRVAADLRRALLAGLGGIADLMLPPVCVHCHEPIADHRRLCASCWREISFITPPLCDRLGIPLAYGDEGEPTLSAQALRDPPEFGRARAVARFDGVMRNLIHGFKYADRHEVAEMLAWMMRLAGADLLADADLLMPVPLHRGKLWRRRYNQAAILAWKLARLSGHPVDVASLRRVRPTRSQVGLSADERRDNIAGAFALAPGAADGISGKRILLIDDVLTTGSTLGGCAALLKQAGAREVDCLAVAMASGGAGNDH